ncbi:hypothetical protein P3T76_001039 [Phytophthora citrophthora]|uniref:Uncharacterized protein n=1 Tax=Phytophthora citrophthora TaxID=4793 RepID=A0AAD9GYN2_9STRA|nr:hypothetical protein P3T76_001039 [Phytophthora citrophthora]
MPRVLHKKTNSSAADWRIRVECGAIRPRAAVYDLAGIFSAYVVQKATETAPKKQWSSNCDATGWSCGMR